MNPHARRHAHRRQLHLDQAPSLEPAHPCLVCYGDGGWHLLTNDDGDPLPAPGLWVECWACDPDGGAA